MVALLDYNASAICQVAYNVKVYMHRESECVCDILVFTMCNSRLAGTASTV